MFETCFDSHRIERINLCPDACVSLMFLFQKKKKKKKKKIQVNSIGYSVMSLT